MYGKKYIMSKRLFTGYICILIFWAFLASTWIIFFPLYESKSSLVLVIRKLLKVGSARDEEQLSGEDSESDRREKLDETVVQVSAL